MADNQQSENDDAGLLPIWLLWPGESVRGVIEDAHAVEREARRLEREAGGHPLMQSFFEFRTAVFKLNALAKALQKMQLNEEQRKLLDNVAPLIEELAGEVDGTSPPATITDLLSAAERLKKAHQTLKETNIPADKRDSFDDVGVSIDKLVVNIRSLGNLG